MTAAVTTDSMLFGHTHLLRVCTQAEKGPCEAERPPSGHSCRYVGRTAIQRPTVHGWLGP